VFRRIVSKFVPYLNCNFVFDQFVFSVDTFRYASTAIRAKF